MGLFVLQFDLNGLADRLREYIANRQFHEQRHLSVEDEGLIGLLNLLTVVIKRNDVYKSSDAAKVKNVAGFGFNVLSCYRLSVVLLIFRSSSISWANVHMGYACCVI